jgi:hypothetical protein
MTLRTMTLRITALHPTAFRTMTLQIITLSITTIQIMTLSIMTLPITIPSISTMSVTINKHNTQHFDIQQYKNLRYCIITSKAKCYLC